LLKTQVDSLAAEVAQLKTEQAKSQELQLLHDKHRAKANVREKSLRCQLQDMIESLRGKVRTLPVLWCARSCMLLITLLFYCSCC
jgi:hypothetical protein